MRTQVDCRVLEMVLPEGIVEVPPFRDRDRMTRVSEFLDLRVRNESKKPKAVRPTLVLDCSYEGTVLIGLEPFQPHPSSEVPTLSANLHVCMYRTALDEERIRRIVIESNSKDDVVLVDVKIGKNSVFAAFPSLPVEAFTKECSPLLPNMIIPRQHDLSFYFASLTDDDRWVKVEVES